MENCEKCKVLVAQITKLAEVITASANELHALTYKNPSFEKFLFETGGKLALLHDAAQEAVRQVGNLSAEVSECAKPLLDEATYHLSLNDKRVYIVAKHLEGFTNASLCTDELRLLGLNLVKATEIPEFENKGQARDS